MTEDIRAFLAVELPEDVKSALGELANHLRRAGVDGLKPVRPENMHLTVKFFGDVSSTRVDSIVCTIERAAKALHPFTLRLGNVGAYPNGRNPRVLWVGLDGDVASLREAHRRIDNALADINIKPDSRKFSPHLTVARLRDRSTSSERRRAAQALFTAEYETGHPIPVERFSLMRSILRPEGPQYTTLADFTLDHGGQACPTLG